MSMKSKFAALTVAAPMMAAQAGIVTITPVSLDSDATTAEAYSVQVCDTGGCDTTTWRSYGYVTKNDWLSNIANQDFGLDWQTPTMNFSVPNTPSNPGSELEDFFKAVDDDNPFPSTFGFPPGFYQSWIVNPDNASTYNVYQYFTQNNTDAYGAFIGTPTQNQNALALGLSFVFGEAGTPVTNNPTPVSEPNGLALGGLAALAAIGAATRRRKPGSPNLD